MGDRSNIRFRQENGQHSIWLYGHWAGTNMALNLQAALRHARPRWHDTAYGTCIVIHHILCHHHLGDDGLPRETGYGLSTFPGDNEHDFLEVDFSTKEVRLRDDAGWFDKDKSFDPETARIIRQWTFEEFCSAQLGEQGELAYEDPCKST